MTDFAEDDITNAERAARINAVLETYNDEWGVTSNLIDLLADARHWCDRESESYAEFDRIAYQHYAVEVVTERRRRT